jgi:rod shape determining protein RodA
MLIGVFFTAPIANVHRWYRLPLIGMSLQPSELAKITCVMAMAWYLEQRAQGWKSLVFCGLIAFIPFVLILKQPDLGAALVIYPITLGMLYYAGVFPRMIRFLGWSGLLALGFIMAIFLGFLSHEEMRPWAIKIFREYQYERLNPGGYHNLAGRIAVSLGSIWGKGWRQGVYSNQGWLPEPYTDSIFASFSEEFGLVGSLFLLCLYGGLCWQSLAIASMTKDRFGQLLVVGLSLYLGIHVLVNTSMMIGLFPITGVALPLMSYGGSASLFAFMALGLIQSVWARRFMF